MSVNQWWKPIHLAGFSAVQFSFTWRKRVVWTSMCTDMEEPQPQRMLLCSENSVTVYRDKNSHPEDHRVMPTHTFTHIQQTCNKSTLVPRLTWVVWCWMSASALETLTAGFLFTQSDNRRHLWASSVSLSQTPDSWPAHHSDYLPSEQFHYIITEAIKSEGSCN